MSIHLALRRAPQSFGVDSAVHPDDGPQGVRMTTGRLDADRLAGVVCSLAVRSDLWQPLVRHHPTERWYQRLAVTEDAEIWLIGWWPGQFTPLHDHGGAEGALVVVAGTLDETIIPPTPADARRRTLRPGRLVRLPASTVHRVGNAGSIPATSIHAYSPPGCEMREIDEAPTAATGVAAASRAPRTGPGR